MLVMVPACPRFARKDDEEVVSYFKGNKDGHMMRPSVILWVTLLATDAIVLGIIYGISGFRTEHSTTAQRVWVTTWLTFGFIFGCFVAVSPSIVAASTYDWESPDKNAIELRWWGVLPVVLLLSPPAIGGFVVVGQMLLAYGHCQRFG